MAVYKIFPEKDASIFSEAPTLNSGISEILDLSKDVSLLYPSYSAVGRALIRFSNTDINNVIQNYVGSKAFSASLKMYLANASDLPLAYNLELYAISGSWDNGTGRIDSDPITTNGVSWLNRTATSNQWSTGIYSPGTTASFFTGNVGGGTWYTSSLVTQSFNNRSALDTNFDVTSIVNQYSSGSLINDGFIIKNASSIEFNTSYQYELSYFSVDTNTIYPPSLDIKWDDSVYIPNTSSMSQIGINSVITLGNNAGVFNPSDVVRFNVNARDQYPTRTFVTSSLYTVNKYLPTSSYYRVRDLDTDNILIDFDPNNTKISTDQNGSFFNLYMNGLEPERYYEIQIKVNIGSNSNVYETGTYFKITKH